MLLLLKYVTTLYCMLMKINLVKGNNKLQLESEFVTLPCVSWTWWHIIDHMVPSC